MTHKELAELLFQFQLKAGSIFGDGSDAPVTHAEAKEAVMALTDLLGSLLRNVR